MNIPDSDLILMDGVCSEATQSLVDGAKYRQSLRSEFEELTTEMAEIIEKALFEFRTNGKIGLRRESISYCRACKKSAGYFPHTRNSTYHRKGDPNHKKPKYLDAYDLHDSYILMRGHVSNGCCSKCFEQLKPCLIQRLADIKAEIPDSLRSSKKYKKVPIMECGGCHWRGPENELGQLRTIMGDGYYYGECLVCKARNTMFNIVINKTNDFIIQEVEEI